MSPSHSSKQGIRYRYYVSQAALQNCKAEVGTIARVSAPDVEAIVSNAIKAKTATDRLNANSGMDSAIGDSAYRQTVPQHVERVIVHRSEIEITWRPADPASPSPDRTTSKKSCHSCIEAALLAKLQPTWTDSTTEGLCQNRPLLLTALTWFGIFIACIGFWCGLFAGFRRR